MRFVKEAELRRRLVEFAHQRSLPGLQTAESRWRFVGKLMDSQKKLRALSMGQFSGSVDPAERDFHPLKRIAEHAKAGNHDEAVWLSFLTIQFGQDVRSTVGLFYGKFGKGVWDWNTVKNDPAQIRNWMCESWPRLKKLKFGNHRKRRIMNPDHPRGTYAVIRSFIDWVGQRGQGSPFRALSSLIDTVGDPAEGFQRLYEALDIVDFGRTARFDFLCLLGDLRVLSIRPGHCYLKDATGPKVGALLLVTGRKRGKLSGEVEDTIMGLQKFLGVPVEAMEDALCNWQKGPKKPRAPEPGYLTVTCE